VRGRNSAVNDKRLVPPTPAVAAIVALACTALACGAEPPVKCTASANPGASRYTLVTSAGDCSGATPFNNKGEVVGVQTYVVSVSDPNTYQAPASVAFQSEEASTLAANGEAVDPPVADADPSHHLYALGTFDQAFPDSNGFCTISTLSTAELNMPDIPAHMTTDDSGMMVPVADQPATQIKYVWSNVRIIVNPDSIGTQTFATLDYTRDACTATFKVSLLTPEVSCDNNGTPDQSLCDAPTDPSIGAVPPGITKCEVQGDQTLCLPIKTEL